MTEKKGSAIVSICRRCGTEHEDEQRGAGEQGPVDRVGHFDGVDGKPPSRDRDLKLGWEASTDSPSSMWQVTMSPSLSAHGTREVGGGVAASDADGGKLPASTPRPSSCDPRRRLAVARGQTAVPRSRLPRGNARRRGTSSVRSRTSPSARSAGLRRSRSPPRGVAVERPPRPAEETTSQKNTRAFAASRVRARRTVISISAGGVPAGSRRAAALTSAPRRVQSGAIRWST